ncbi:hypothetical protein NDU88_010190 [Pleurodeles waltl]|uniref:Uncharacterized protein n=1 Tax=Pleurodeles waltl TaxID=8319 RepID=A0AAV7RZY4_PLEWA|nr:hypothetical protein NDU88_010190 [Pleurodeles waltl]
MAAEAKVQQALLLLEEAGRLDLVRPGAALATRPMRKAASGVAVAVMACSPLRRVTGAKKVSLLGKGKARSGSGWDPSAAAAGTDYTVGGVAGAE